MHKRLSILLICVLFVTFLVAGCGSDSTTPEDTGPAAFSRMVGGSGTDNTLMGDVVVRSDGVRVVAGTCGNLLRITGSNTTLDPAGTSRVFFLGFKPDGSLAWKTIVPGGGTPPTIRAIARDSANNLLMTGTFGLDVTFGTTGLTNIGLADMFIAKFDADGQPVWAQACQGALNDDGDDIAAAADGSIYVIGNSTGEITVGGITAGPFGKNGGFLAKMNSGGTGVWQKTVYPDTRSTCFGVAVSQDGSVLMCGDYEGASVSIDGQALPNDGSANGFVSRFGADGIGQGNIRIGGPGAASPRRITTINNEPIVAGAFSGTVDFDVNTPAGSVAAVGVDAFVARYSKSGELRWVVVLGGTDDQLVVDLAHTGSGEILVCGTFRTVISAGSKSLTALGMEDAYLIRISGSGQVLSARRVGGSAEETAAGLASSSDAAIMVGTTKSNDVTFPDGTQRPLFGQADSFILQQP